MVVISRKIEEWYKGFSKEEKIWMTVAFLAAIILAVTTLTWPLVDSKHEVPTVAIEMSPSEFKNLADNFASQYSDKPVPPGTKIYIMGFQYYWSISKITLYKDVEYEIWISSGDVLHGFSLVGKGVVYNIMVMPVMVYKVNVMFKEAGIYYIICNEYCGAGHAGMRAIVEVIG